MKQFQILTILSLINFNSQAMFRRPAALIKLTTTARFVPTSSSSSSENVKRLELAIANGQIEEAKKIMRYHWINESGQTISKKIYNSQLPEETKCMLSIYYQRASDHYLQDVACESARNCNLPLEICDSKCFSHCRHAHDRLANAIQKGDIEQIKLIMKYRWIDLGSKDHAGKTIPELAKQSKHPAVVTLFESYHNNATV